jgi:hypothetical protein
MAYGDVNFEIAKTSSVVYATTGLSQQLLLTDNSLSSTYNLDEVFIIDVELANANAFRIAPSSLSNNIGISFNEGSAVKTLPPMKVRNINQLAAYNASASANASVVYTFWRKLPK